ncbi:MAG: hypothetical protein ACRELB_07790, partial [Polyangiaceae bacterium]
MMARRALAWIVAVIALVSACSAAPTTRTEPEPLATSQSALGVTWTNVVGVSTTSTSLTKTGTTGWNAGASSVASITDGYMEFTTDNTTTTYKMVGLSHSVTDSGFADIDFAFYINPLNGFEIWEDGAKVPPTGYFGWERLQPGQPLRIQVSGTLVQYYQGGVLIYTSQNHPLGPLVVAASIYDTGGAISHVNIQSTPVVWQHLAGLTTSGDDLVKAGGDGWDTAAMSVASLGAGGTFAWTSGETTTYKMVGLTHAVTGVGFADIDYGILMGPGGSIAFYEGGSQVGTWIDTVSPGKQLQISVSASGDVTMLNYTSPRKARFPLYGVASLYSSGSTVNFAYMTGDNWLSITGVEADGPALTKTGPAGWNAFAVGNSPLTANGSVLFTTAESNAYKLVGLGPTDGQAPNILLDYGNYPDIAFGFFLQSNGAVSVYESGLSVKSLGSYAPGDVFQVQVTGSQVKYVQNGTTLYTSTKTAVLPLYPEAALYTPGATVDISSWQDVVGVDVSGQQLAKAGDDGWDAGATTVASLAGDGYFEFSSDEANTYKMVGLTHAVTDSSYDTIDFGVFLQGTGAVGVFEQGASVGTFGTYAAGDTFR